MSQVLNRPSETSVAIDAPTVPDVPSTRALCSSTAAIVLAGSYSWTNSSFERLRARPLLPIAQSPMIVHVLRELGKGGISEATICANGSTAAMKSFFDTAPPAIAVDYYEDASPRGAAGCLRDAAQRTNAQTLIVTECSIHSDVSLEALVARHHERGAALTVAVSREDQPGAGAFLNPTGLYVVDRRVLDYISAQGYQDIKENFIPQLHAAGERIEIFETSRGCPHVLSARSYLAANQWMIQRLVGQAGLLADESDYRRTADVMVHTSARVDPSATLVGPVLVGPGAQIEAGAVVIGPTAIGTGTTLGRNTAVSRSVIWNHTRIAEGAVVDRSILADHANVPAGVRLQGVVQGPEPVSRGALGSWLRGTPNPMHARRPAVGNLAMSVR